MTRAPLITPEMLRISAQFDAAEGQWQALRTLTLEGLLAAPKFMVLLR